MGEDRTSKLCDERMNWTTERNCWRWANFNRLTLRSRRSLSCLGSHEPLSFHMNHRMAWPLIAVFTVWSTGRC